MAIAALWFGATTWLRPLAIPDEGRYVGVAWEMLRSGDWVVPTLNGAPFLHKPPLFYWITAASMYLLGPGVETARAAPWLAAVATTTGLFAFVHRWIGREQGWASAAVLATMPIFYGGSQYANMDMLVAGCINAAILLGAHAALERERGAAYTFALAGAFGATACGFLAKGLIGLLLPATVLIAWGLATQRARKLLALFAWAPGWLLFIAIAGPWLVLMQQRFPNFAHYFFVVQHFDRFVSSGFNNLQPVWFYPVILLLLSAPWSYWFVPFVRARNKTRGRTRVQADVHTLMIAWPVVVTVFFSLPNSKLVGYILPAIAPLAYLVADAIRSSRTTWLRPTAALAAATCVSAAVLAHYYQPKSMQRLATQLRASRRPSEPIFFLRNYYYDTAFYARLDGPVTVVDLWLPEENAKDSWRRELSDAQTFAAKNAQPHLLNADALANTLCHAPITWLIGGWPAPPEFSWLAQQAPAYRLEHTALWRLDSRAPALRTELQCDSRSQGAARVISMLGK